MQSNNTTLYDLLGIAKTATQSEITKAYRTMAIRVHPDKNLDDYANAQKNFQKLLEAYSILNDPKKRELYDRTGETEASDDFFEAYEYYRAVHPKLTKQDIQDFSARYKNSSEEVEDLVRFYLLKNGDMTAILEYIPLSERSDLERFWKLFDELIEAGKIPKSKKYSGSKKKVKDLADESEQMTREEKKRDEDGMDSLIAKIQGKKQGNPDQFLKYLEEKYSEKPKKKGKKRGN